jgi:hypothetical protein
VTEREFYAGELHGYRSWRAMLTPDGPRLVALTRGEEWKPGRQPVAVHDGYAPAVGHGHEAPGPNCDCGYYGYFQPEGKNLQTLTDHLRVAGVIRGSGRVWMHEEGFRASYAEVLALAPTMTEVQPDQMSGFARVLIGGQVGEPRRAKAGALQLLADYYGVPWFETFDEMVKAFPPTHENEKAPEPAPGPFSSGGLVWGGGTLVGNSMSFTLNSSGFVITKAEMEKFLADLGIRSALPMTGVAAHVPPASFADALEQKKQQQDEHNQMSKKDKRRRMPWLR